jgi:hypothetical protein
MRRVETTIAALPEVGDWQNGVEASLPVGVG